MALRSGRNLRRGLIALAIALPALYAVSAGVAIVQDYRSTIKQAESDMRNIAATLHEHAMRSFGAADTRLRVAIAGIEQRGLAPCRRTSASCMTSWSRPAAIPRWTAVLA